MLNNSVPVNTSVVARGLPTLSEMFTEVTKQKDVIVTTLGCFVLQGIKATNHYW